MATRENLNGYERLQVALLPVSTDSGSLSLITSRRFGPFPAEAGLVLVITAAAHVLAGSDSVVVTTSGVKLLPGVYKFGLPDNCTHVALIDSADGAGVGTVYLG